MLDFILSSENFQCLNSLVELAMKFYIVTVHRQAILLLVVESGTRENCLLTVCYLFVESGTYDVICQFCRVKGMVVESEVLKAQNCALSKFSLPMHCNAAGILQNIKSGSRRIRFY